MKHADKTAGVTIRSEESRRPEASSGQLLREIATELTLIFTEHDMRVVFSIAKQITVLHQGRVIADGPPDEVSRDPTVRSAYLGEESVA